MKIYTSPNLTMVAHVKNILEAQNIKCMIRNQYSSAALGEIPLNECWPELYVLDPRQVRIAEEIVKDIIDPNTKNMHPWACPDCKEIVEGQFTACWKCGKEKDELI